MLYVMEIGVASLEVNQQGQAGNLQQNMFLECKSGI